MNNCLILFGVSGILFLIAKLFEIWGNINSYIGTKPPENFLYKFCELIYFSVMIVALVTFFTTLIFAIYIFIFQYTPSLYYS